MSVRLDVSNPADGAFYNTGQSCCSVERIHVHERLFAPFVDAFVAEVKRFRIGDPRDSATYIGPLARSAQLAVLEAQVEDVRVKAGVFTRDRRRARRILAQVNAGSVHWNCCDRVSPRLPWSGVGRSGIGLTLSRSGIETFTRPKAWHLRAP